MARREGEAGSRSASLPGDGTELGHRRARVGGDGWSCLYAYGGRASCDHAEDAADRRSVWVLRCDPDREDPPPSPFSPSGSHERSLPD